MERKGYPGLYERWAGGEGRRSPRWDHHLFSPGGRKPVGVYITGWRRVVLFIFIPSIPSKEHRSLIIHIPFVMTHQ